MLDALADGEDGGVGRAHLVVDDDAALGLEADLLAELDVGLDADGHDDEVTGQEGAVLQLDAVDTVFGSADGGGVGLGDDMDAAALEVGAQHAAGGGVELALHERRHQVEHCDFHAGQSEAVGGFEAEQPAADHHGIPALLGGCQHLVDVRDVAEADDAREVAADERQDERVRPGGQQQDVVWAGGAFLAVDDAFGAVDVPHALAADQLDAVPVVPGVLVDDDLLERLLARQHRAEHDPVVVRVRLGAEHADAEFLRAAGEDFLDGPHAGHAVADDHEAESGGRDRVHRCLLRLQWGRPGWAAVGLLLDQRSAGRPS